jgi:serine/threonine protein kinase
VVSNGMQSLGPGNRIAGYMIEDQVGAGGMAVVYRARDEVLGRVAAVKVLSPSLAADEDFRTRFLRESRAIASVDEPHILPVYAAGESDGVLYIATRFVAGGDLAGLVRASGGPLSADRVANIITQVAAGLDAAHAIGLVHRDVKPGNVLIENIPGRPEHAYLSDFGLIKATSGATGLTATGMFMGTPDYCAPEQITGKPVSGASDQYALGCVAFSLLTGTLPFQRDDTIAVLFAHVRDEVPPLTAIRPELPPAVNAVIARAMAKEAGGRYRSCGEFANALHGALTGPAQPAQPAPTSVPPAREYQPTWLNPQPQTPPGLQAPSQSSPPGPAYQPMAASYQPQAPQQPFQPQTPPQLPLPTQTYQPQAPQQPFQPQGSYQPQQPFQPQTFQPQAPQQPFQPQQPPFQPQGFTQSPAYGTSTGQTYPGYQPGGTGKKSHKAAIIGGIVGAVVLVAGGIGVAVALSGPTVTHHSKPPAPPVTLSGATDVGTLAPPVGGTMSYAFFSPDGSLIAAAGGPDHKANLYLFSAKNDKYLRTITMPKGGQAYPLTFTPNEEWVIAVDGATNSSGNRTLYEFNVATGKVVGSVQEPGATYAVDDLGDVEANETRDAKHIDIYDLTSGHNYPEYEWANPTTAATVPDSLDVSSNGSRMLISAANGKTYVMSSQTGQTLATYDYTYNPSSLQLPELSPDGKTVYIPGGATAPGKLWNVDSGDNVTPRDSRWPQKNGWVIFSIDGQVAATSAVGSPSTDLWNVSLGSHTTTVVIPNSGDWIVADLGPSGSEALFGSDPVDKSNDFKQLYLYTIP